MTRPGRAPIAGLARWLALVWLLTLCWPLAAGAEVAVPPLTARVIDQTGSLTAAQANALEARLQALEAKTGSQIAVLLVPTTAPETIEQYSLRVAEQWQLGRKGVDDGAVLLVAKDDHAMRIEVGYGLEGALTDATSKRIISEIVTPYFRRGDFYGGINAGVERMIAVVEGEPLPPPAATRRGEGGGVFELFPVILVLVFALGGVLRAIFGRVLGAMLAGGATAVIAWMVSGAFLVAIAAGAIALFFTLLGGVGGRRGMWFPPGGGHGGFGSGGSGGFSGGGGGFGGGGASGRW